MILSFDLRFEAGGPFISTFFGWFDYLKDVESLTNEQIFICSLVYSSKIGVSLNASFKDVVRILKECNFNLNELRFHSLGSDPIR